MWIKNWIGPKPHFQVIIKAGFGSNSSMYPCINYPLSSVHKAVRAAWKWQLITALLASVLRDPKAHKGVKATAPGCACVRAGACLSCLLYGLQEMSKTREKRLEGRPGKVTFEADGMCITHAFQLCWFYKAEQLPEEVIFKYRGEEPDQAWWICLLAVGESYIFFKSFMVDSNA